MLLWSESRDGERVEARSGRYTFSDEGLRRDICLRPDM